MMEASIKQIRQSLRMTVEEFAKATEVKPHTVRRWEMNPAKEGARTPNRYSAMLIEQLAHTRQNMEGGGVMTNKHQGWQPPYSGKDLK